MLRKLNILAILVVSVCLMMDSLALSAPGEQESRRITRSRYKMGYMFGKRSDFEGETPSLLIKSLTGKAISVEELSHDLQTDPALALRVARHLDRNGDGYVSVSEVL